MLSFNMKMNIMVTAIIFVVWTQIDAQAPDDIVTIDAAANRFASNLFFELIRTSKNKGNLVMAPRSIFTFISILLAATGKTAELQIRRALNLAPSPPKFARVLFPYRYLAQWPRDLAVNNEAIQMTLAKHIFLDSGLHLKSEFLDLLKNQFGVSVTEVPLTKDPKDAVSTIVKWIGEILNMQADNFLLPAHVSPLSKLFFTSGATLSGQWQWRFVKDKQEKFQCLDPNVVQNVEMMETESEFLFVNYPYYQSRLVYIPYQDKKTQMVIILPFAKTGLNNLEKILLNRVKITSILQQLKPRKTLVKIRMPQFKIRSHISFKNALSGTIGLKDLFQASKVDYSPMTPAGKEMFVADILQEAFVQVNDKGGDVPLGAASVLWSEGAPPRVEEFTVDHPFLFVVIDEKQTPLFLGRVVCL